ncbi:DUF1697 domain-containing protein [Belliella kenyensis]|uniref:DUF1697 domain-containing protein n=1 Tax=Belliella kenyensis TaxID=1472724 RepID=A0ABV8EFQ9_9BACT|nr:DUF1697 domain-containing protein [Belliella kenyensis]MCH7401814.1 DUF1697 domain-containing protein [Belliella kenyensis]MDN3604314.1 DUF1697 domain-containing protein [Belliella kenyensis]
MPTYISILRGINVSGKNLIKMDSLKKLFLRINFENIQTYLQSGNVIFNTNQEDIRLLESAISHEIKTEFGYEVPVIVLSIDELSDILSKNPYAKTMDNSFLHVTFLAHEPENLEIAILTKKLEANEAFFYYRRTIFLYLPNGYGKTKLNNNFIENKLKITATTRNWKTTNEILKIAKEKSM